LRLTVVKKVDSFNFHAHFASYRNHKEKLVTCQLSDLASHSHYTSIYDEL